MGRKPKYENPQAIINAFYQAVSDSYHTPSEGEQGRDGNKKQELLAEEFEISRIKVRKILITMGDATYPEARQIQSIIENGQKPDEVLGMAPSTINSFLPYSKGIYKLSEVSAAAERTRLYRDRKEAVAMLQSNISSVNLWKTIILFQGYPFMTSGRHGDDGVRFKYSISEPGGKGGRHYNGDEIEGFGNEIIVQGKEKTISRSTVDYALKNALLIQKKEGCVSGPKKLNAPGAHSYLYSVFLRFGVITRVPKTPLSGESVN